MPAKDIYHEPVKKALINDGWRIIADPFIIKYKDAELYADPDYQIFLAIDHITYKELFQRPSIQVIINQNNLNLLIVNMSQEIINQWIP